MPRTLISFDFRSAFDDQLKILKNAGIRDTSELRRRLREGGEKAVPGVDTKARGVLTSFAELARVFPEPVAMVLQKHDIARVEDLRNFDGKKLVAILRAAGLSQTEAAHQLLRLQRLQDRLEKGEPGKEISGLALDVPDIAPQELKRLDEAGIETLGDWARSRRNVRVDPKFGRRLDGHARLGPLGLSGEIAGRLIDEGLSSAVELARLDDQQVATVARRVNVDQQELRQSAQTAAGYVTAVASLLDNSRAGAARLPEWWAEIITTLPIDLCVTCAEENSAFSRFAYYVYLVQRSGEALEELEKILGLNRMQPPIVLKALSPLSDEEIIPDPLAACDRISILRLVIRLLQDYLIDRRNGSTSRAERRELELLDFADWRAQRMAYFFPELAALWRDDILTGEDGPADRGSILKDRPQQRVEIEEQLATVEAILQVAVISKSGNAANTLFNSDGEAVASRVTPLSETPFFDEFSRGLQAIRAVLNADDAVQQALTHLDADQPGLALDQFNLALARLDALAAAVFRPDSPWTNEEQQVRRDYDLLVDAPPQLRKEILTLLGEELFGNEAKRIFTHDLSGLPTLITSHLPNGQVVSLDPWSAASDYRLAKPNEVAVTPGLRRRLMKDVSGDNNSTRIFRYREGDQLTDYRFSATVQVLDGASFDTSDGFRDGEHVGIAVRDDGASRYELVVLGYVAQPPGTGGVQRHALVLRKIAGGQTTELTRSDSVPGEIGLSYVLDMSVRTIGNSADIAGKLVIPSIDREILLGFRDDQPLQRGTFSLIASRSIASTFDALSVDVVATPGTGPAPFFADRRVGLEHGLSSESIYLNRDDALAGMASALSAAQLIVPAGEALAVPLAGANRHLAFEKGTKALSLDNLDLLLDQCLALSFYLRFAVIPTRTAQALLLRGDYERAADRLHLLLDDTAPGSVPTVEVYPHFAQPPETITVSSSPDVRLVCMRLAEVYLAHAEWLFRKDTPDGRHKARRLCEQVLALIGEGCDCDRQIGVVTETVRDRQLRPYIERPDIPLLDDPARFENILEGLYGDGRKVPDLIKLLEEHLPDNGVIDPVEFAKDVERFASAVGSAAAGYDQSVARTVTHSAVLQRSDQLIMEAELAVSAVRRRFDGEGKPESRSTIFSGFAVGFGSGASGGGRFGMGKRYSYEYGEFQYDAFCIPANPLKTQQKKRACLLLDLINSCHNILGFPGGFVPPLRFETLIRIARSFTQDALEAENDLLSIRRALEEHLFSILEAESSLALNNAEESFERLNVGLAQGDIRLADLQFLQVAHNREHFQDLIDSGLTGWEQLSLNAAWTSAVFSGFAAGFSAVAAVPALASAGLAAFGLAQMGTGVFASTGAITTAAGLLGTVASGPQSLASASGAAASAAGAVSSAASMQASFERREQEWTFQRDQGAISIGIAAVNVTQAGRRFDIARRRQEIAALRTDLARDAVTFLHNKFLDTATLVWMMRTVREQYRTRLNYAIEAGFMAERALAFELQKKSLDIVRFDYFDPKRDGLLGATQLKTDLGTLESTRLAFSEPKLQVSRTLSMAELMPMELEQFKTGPGLLRFSTLLDWFDRDFPGHYLCLIKAVKVTLVALVPPHDGIRATLRNSGVSNVVVGPPLGDGFVKQTIRRNPASVALSVPFQASGRFVLDFNDANLLPFEGSGIETDWMFELPRAANRFDYRTIADVLVTVDYTAIASDSYREQVIARIGRNFIGDRPFSFRQHFADSWYDLHHPELVEPPQQPMRVRFTTRREDFPANLVPGSIVIDAVRLLIVRREGTNFELPVTLQYSTDGSTFSGGTATTTQGIVAEGLGNAAPWAPIQGKPPVGIWELELPDTTIVKTHFANEDVQDIVIVITLKALVEDWPGI